MIPSVYFSALQLGLKGKTTIAEDNKTGKSVVFSDYDISYRTNPPKAILKDDQGRKVAEYPVHRKDGLLPYWIDQLDVIGLEG